MPELELLLSKIFQFFPIFSKKGVDSMYHIWYTGSMLRENRTKAVNRLFFTGGSMADSLRHTLADLALEVLDPDPWTEEDFDRREYLWEDLYERPLHCARVVLARKMRVWSWRLQHSAARRAVSALAYRCSRDRVPRPPRI